MKKSVLAVGAAIGGVGALVRSQLPEIRRYLKISSM
ncbi:MAG: hypothetical protein QOF37_1267 [Thermoleophilaceae bacterium]|jgi:hypothetical protein|nr:hypothetical protein [Thermoleophilaceae bacterium]